MTLHNSYNSGGLYTQCQRGEYQGSSGVMFGVLMVVLALAATGAGFWYFG